MKHGDFSGLSENYSKYRLGYSQSVLKGILALLDKPISNCHLVDIGAGTGIWTRMLSNMSPSSIIAIEPNDEMRNIGIKDSQNTKIIWKNGSAEQTHLKDKSADLVSMASSLHWVNFEKGCKEFHRILKEKGRFVALWNPRLIDSNSILQEIEDYILKLNPRLKRVSSGRSGITEHLTEKLYISGFFSDIIYMEGRHTTSIPLEHYIRIWKSANDVQFQLGQKKFYKFLNYVKLKLAPNSFVDVTYITRAWSALKV